ncbi:DNA polymerase alpha, subunit B N-terminal [Phytophthora cactorum]|nr:DNA polymerase alpha, subunit B N-terminal [Phytophthora cactorum]
MGPYSMNQQLSGAANADGLVAFRSHLKQQQQQTKAQEAAPTAASQKRRHPKTPVPSRQQKVQRKEGMFSPSSMQSPPGSSYEKRTDAGKSVADFNGHLRKQIEGMGANTGKPVDVKAPFPSRNLAPNSSYMYTPLFQRAIALDEQLVEYEELVKEKFKLEELKPVGDPSPAQVTVVGRIVCEAAEGKLNPSVVQIEGSRKTCGGQRVLLDLSAVPNFQIFPGKHHLLHRPARIKEIQSEHGNPVRVLTACGPFTTTSNVDYLPLNDLLQIAIDQNQTYFSGGPVYRFDALNVPRWTGQVRWMMLSFEEIFLFKVMTLLNNVLSQDERIQIVIVPSLRDANHEYVYPQPPLNKKKACEAFEAVDYAKRVHFMSNPSTFSINEVVFGTSALDVVVQLSSNELYSCRSAKLLPNVSPPPNSEAPIDLRYMKQFQFEQTPDILLLPSILNRFCGFFFSIQGLQDQLRRLKRRCAKLERKLQEKEADIQTLQEQQQLRFPLLMHETMRSLRSLEDNQSDRTASPSLLSHSVISSMAHDRIDVDTRIHEYEQQIAELYEENQQEKLKNEMLSECLRDQKHAKRAEQESQQKATAKQLEDLILESTKWEGLTVLLAFVENMSKKSAQRKKVEEAQRELQRLTTENDFLREQLASQYGERLRQDDDSSCAAQETYDKLLIQMYEETNTVDINLLDEEDSFRNNFSEDDTLAAHSCEEYAIQLSGSVLEAARYASELQQVVEDASARLIGSTCALQ